MEPFVNITVFYSPNHAKQSRLSSFQKSIDLLDQLQGLVYSIRKNWHSFDYDITVFHSSKTPLNERDWEVLKVLEVDTIEVEPDTPELPHYCRAACFDHPLEFPGTHRLVLDIDMVALAEPKLNFDVDFQAMFNPSIGYRRDVFYKVYAWMSQKLGMKPVHADPSKTWDFNFPAHKVYHETGKWDRNRFFPYFNGGAVLIKDNKAKELTKLWRPTIYLASGKDWMFKNPNMAAERTLSAALVTVADSWEPFPPGFNSLHRLVPTDPYPVSLFHYCGHFKFGDKRYSKVFSLLEEAWAHYKRLLASDSVQTK